MADTLPERFGRFRVLDILGRGAMGVVYRAQDSALGRTVAIKTIALTGSGAERDIHEARFLQEARAAGGVGHPSIITIYDVGREGDVAFIAMELLEGRELRDVIREGLLGPSRAVAIVAAVAEGLGVAHERGVIHRDIKPSNIMLLPDGRIKIMDFGIARLHEPTVKTQTGVMLGSPQYMSPEQITNQGLDHRTDIFSLGVVLYEMLTGLRPFGGEDLPQVLFAVANLPAKPPTHLVAGLPSVLDYVIARALKKNPTERYLTAAEFARDLRDCLDEVTAAEAMAAARGAEADAATLPQGGAFAGGAGSADTAPMHESVLELRASPRFDSVEGLARLAVLPADSEQTESRAGWTVRLPRLQRHLDRLFTIILAAYVIALIAAMVMVML